MSEIDISDHQISWDLIVFLASLQLMPFSLFAHFNRYRNRSKAEAAQCARAEGRERMVLALRSIHCTMLLSPCKIGNREFE